MPKTKSKPVAKKSPKGTASKQSKKKTGSSTPLLKAQGEAFEEGIAAASLPPKTAKKRTAKATPEPAPAPHAATSETTPAVVLPDVKLLEATTPIESASDVVAPVLVVEIPARGASEETGSEAGPAGAPSVLEPAEPRMPPVGTVITKLDRQGAVRCECTVVEGGVQYAGKVYKSLSAAAIAAAKDLGLRARAINGYAFFGLSKPARGASHADPTVGLQRSFDRYTAQLDTLLEKAGENREPVLTRLQRHARILQNLHDEVA